jgi:hypothetical protein
MTSYRRFDMVLVIEFLAQNGNGGWRARFNDYWIGLPVPASALWITRRDPDCPRATPIIFALQMRLRAR